MLTKNQPLSIKKTNTNNSSLPILYNLSYTENYLVKCPFHSSKVKVYSLYCLEASTPDRRLKNEHSREHITFIDQILVLPV